MIIIPPGALHITRLDCEVASMPDLHRQDAVTNSIINVVPTMHNVPRPTQLTN